MCSSAGDTAINQGRSKMQNNQVTFKAKGGNIRIKATLIKQVDGGAIVEVAGKQFFIESNRYKVA